MLIRFKLYEGSDADLIALIKEMANGDTPNTAARFLMRHWFKNELMAFSPPQRSGSDAVVSDRDMSNEDLNEALTIIDDDFGSN